MDMKLFTTNASVKLFQLMYIQALGLKALPSLVNCKILVIYDILATVCELDGISNEIIFKWPLHCFKKEIYCQNFQINS